MSIDEIEYSCNQEWETAEKERKNTLRKIKDHREKYDAMLDQVKAWVPPTQEHVGLKEFMLEQLRASMYHDCDTTFYVNEIKKEDPTEWLQRKIKRATDDIVYWTKDKQKELERYNGREQWIKDLVSSLSN